MLVFDHKFQNVKLYFIYFKICFVRLKGNPSIVSEVRPLKTVKCATRSHIWSVALSEVPQSYIYLENVNLSNRIYRNLERGYLHICDLVAYLTVFNGRTSDSRTFEKMTVKSATIIKLHYRDNLTLYNNYWRRTSFSETN